MKLNKQILLPLCTLISSILVSFALASCSSDDGSDGKDAGQSDSASGSDSAAKSDSAVQSDSAPKKDTGTPTDSSTTNDVQSDGNAGHPETGSIDCGKHGHSHDDHCHCDSGYLFDGKTCVTPDKITEVCEEHEEQPDADKHHDHEACVCPSTGACPCKGKFEEIGNQKYCVPDPHAHH